jgi:hypothetical protein
MTDKARLGKDPFKASGVNSLIQDTRDEGFHLTKRWEYKEVLAYEGFINTGMGEEEFRKLAKDASHWITSSRNTAIKALGKYKDKGQVSELPDYMNTLGAQGWELVSVIYEPGRESLKLFFKRPAVG